jgi:hypothetical protein
MSRRVDQILEQARLLGALTLGLADAFATHQIGVALHVARG